MNFSRGWIRVAAGANRKSVFLEGNFVIIFISTKTVMPMQRAKAPAELEGTHKCYK
jgi:hypothetical protein